MTRATRLLLIIAASAFVSAFLFSFGLLENWQETFFDRLFLKKPPPDAIIIIGIDEESIARLGQWPWPRAVFAKLLTKTSTAKAVGFNLTIADPSRAGFSDDQALAAALADFPGRMVMPLQIDTEGAILSQPIPVARTHVDQGFANVSLDYDGIARRVDSTTGTYKSFGLVMAGDDISAPPRFRVDYRGPAKTFPTISFVDVLEDRVPERIFKDKLVLVGVTDLSLHDTVQTPFGMMSGVEFHANAISTILDQRFYQEPSIPSGIAAILALHAVIFLLVLRLQRITALFFAFLSTFVLLILLALVLFNHYIVTPAFYLVLGYLISAFLSVMFQYATEAKEKRFIRRTFQYYLPHHIIEELVRHPEKLKLGGEMKTITIFFSDIRGFSTISEGLTPTQLTQLLNEYLTAMTDIIIAKNGLVDKYIGDGTMAFWGAPLPNPRQAADACEAAVEMIEALEHLNKDWKERDFPPIKIGIGINLGEVVVGNMGSHSRFNYTLMGDEVNLAARLEGLTKYYGVNCIVTQSVHKDISALPHLITRELDWVRVKGKKESSQIFEVVTRPMDEARKEIFKHFTAGREAYTRGEWDEALTEFEKALKIGDDGPSRLFVERTKALKKNPPSEWAGIHEFTEK